VSNVKNAIFATFAEQDAAPLLSDSDGQCEFEMSQFAPVTASEVKRLLSAMPLKQ
jgi:hypothetical protein